MCYDTYVDERKHATKGIKMFAIITLASALLIVLVIVASAIQSADRANAERNRR